MGNPWPAIVVTACGIRLWVRYKLPWKTKGHLRDLVRQRSDEAEHAIGGLREYHARLEREIEAVNQLRLDLNTATEEAKSERLARVELEGQRIQEHEALGRLAFGLSNGLEATLGLVNDFLLQLPDYRPDQADRAEVMQGLVKQVH